MTSFPRFALTSATVTAFYLLVILGFALIFGHAAFDWVGDWAWLALIAPLLVAALLRGRLANRNRRAT